MSITSNTTPPYICQWEEYSSALNLDTFHKLLPVHDNILKVLEQVIPSTIIRLSKKHYNQVIPILYRHIKFDSTNTERFFRGWTASEHPQEEIHWSDRQKEMMKYVKTISFLDEKSMLDFNRIILAYHQLIKNDDILTNFFSQITHIQLGQQLVMASGRKWSEGDEASTALAILLGCFNFYLNQYNVCFDVPEDTCAEERNDLSPNTIVTEEEHNRTCHIRAFWDGIHAIFEIVEGLRNEPQTYIFHWPNDGYTMMRGITNLITYRKHHFLNSPIILDLSGMEVEVAFQLSMYIKPSSLFSFVDHEGHKRDTDIHLVASDKKELALLMAVLMGSENPNEGQEAEELLGMVSYYEERIMYWKDEDEENAWKCPCGHGRRKPSEEEEEEVGEDDAKLVK
ncbi:hypothetical protein V865_004469 [Kwoniella europaea PYCC6329]|uniref:HNH nuclease domain-containing protein n=1 Tax=Kwoniella europaea PYCC6329 TaxID=1423913 RepID=A0AAX4KJN5_9TREE